MGKGFDFPTRPLNFLNFSADLDRNPEVDRGFHCDAISQCRSEAPFPEGLDDGPVKQGFVGRHDQFDGLCSVFGDMKTGKCRDIDSLSQEAVGDPGHWMNQSLCAHIAVK